MRIGAGRRIASLVVVIFSIVVVGLLLTFVGQQIASGAGRPVRRRWSTGSSRSRTGCAPGRSTLSDHGPPEHAQGPAGLARRQRRRDRHPEPRRPRSAPPSAHIVAGFFIVLFATYFFLADGDRDLGLVRAARSRAPRGCGSTRSGRVALDLADPVRAGHGDRRRHRRDRHHDRRRRSSACRSSLAIGVLVFLGAFVPMIGAFVAGTVAVLVALVDQGPITALLMLAGVVARPADRGPRPAAVPDGPLRLGAPARRDRGDRARRARRRHPGRPGRRTARGRRSTPSCSTSPSDTDVGRRSGRGGGARTTSGHRPRGDDRRRRRREGPTTPRTMAAMSD